MRRKTGLLMHGAQPEGGQWNYDRLNRQRPAADHVFPAIPRFEPDGITRGVMDQVAHHFSSHFGELDGFWMPVTRRDAERFFEDFLEHRLDMFGPYEDAIVVGQPALYHSLISSLLNIGLLEPLDVCRQAEACYYQGKARLNSVEGFIRQIIGWREFIYQVYHLKMPDNSLYWDFLARNREKLERNPRMNLTLAMLDRLDPGELEAIRHQAAQIRTGLKKGGRI